MPTFTEETTPYEVLLRFNEGQLSGAHYQTITQVKRDGLSISSQIDTPQQLALIEGEEGQMLGEVLGEITAAAIIDNQVLTAAMDAKSQELESASAHNSELTVQLEQVSGALTAANSKVDELTALLEQVQAALAASQEVTEA